MKVNEIIRARRKELGLTLKQVADKLGVSESLISRYESNDVKNMGIDKLIPLAKVLKTTPTYLMGRENNKNFISEQNVNNNNPDILTFYRADVKGLTEDEKEELKKDLEKYTDFLLQKIKEKNKK